jgi:hypothetical protein
MTRIRSNATSKARAPWALTLDDPFDKMMVAMGGIFAGALAGQACCYRYDGKRDCEDEPHKPSMLVVDPVFRCSSWSAAAAGEAEAEDGAVSVTG